jgi:hypothetical protein
VDVAKAPTSADIAAGLSVAERVLLFCIASGTDWSKVATHSSVRHMIVCNLIDRAGGGYVLTPQGRAVLNVLVQPPENEQDGD